MIARLASPLRATTALAVLLSLGIAAAPVFWHLRGHSGALPAPIDRAPDTAAPAAEPADIGPILALAPFGEVAAPVPEQGPIGETTLDLVLHGVVVRDDPAASTAFIGQGGTTLGYHPGDRIGDRAMLVEVTQVHVVLEVDGELQTLSFPDPTATGGAVAAPVAPGTDRLRAAIAGQTSAAAAAPPETTDDYIEMWRDRITQNPGEVLDAIGLIPTENGYRIADEHDSGVSRAGLRAGDLVTSVNGQTVGDVTRDRKLYDEVAASGLARIEIQRDGRTITMSFPLR